MRSIFEKITLLVGLTVALACAGCGPNDGGEGSGEPEPQADMGPMTQMDQGEDPNLEPDPEADTQAPTISITSSMVADPEGRYTLEGTARDDVGVASLSYTAGSGAEPVELELDGERFEASLELPEDPTTIVVRAEDAAGNQASAEVTVAFEQPGELMGGFTVSAAPRMLDVVTFDASESVDPQGRELRYTWSFGDGAQAQGESTGRIFEQGGPLEVSLIVEAGDDSVEVSRTITIEEPTPMGQAMVEGLVVDDERGGLPEVAILDAQGQELGRTGPQGAFQIQVPRAAPQVLRLRKPGWADQLMRVEIPASAQSWPARAQMTRRGGAYILRDAQRGGEIEGPLGARVTFPPDAFVDANGEPVRGDVIVSMTPVVTEGERLGGFPGSFDAMREDGQPGMLSTYGVVEVDLSRNGEPIELAEDARATLEIPMTTAAPAGSEIALWSLHEPSGLWVQEGTGEVVEARRAPAGVAMRAEVSHFSWWNVDLFSGTGQIGVNFGYAGAPPTDPPEAFHVVGGTPDEFDGPKTRGALRRVRLNDGGSIRVPIGQPFRIEASSTDGRYACSITRTFADTDTEASCELEPQVPEPSDSAILIEYGQTVPLELEQDDSRLKLLFDGQAGDFVRLEVSTSLNGSTGVAITRSIFGLQMARRPWEPQSPARVIYQVPETGRNVIELQAVLAGPVGVRLEKLAGPTLQLEQSQQVTLEPDQDSEWVFWGNQGQVVHAFAFGEQRPGVRWELELRGDRLDGERGDYGGTSRLFELPETGLYLLRLSTAGAFLTEDLEHNVSLTEVAPAAPVALGDGSERFEGRLWVPGKVVRYEVAAASEDAFFARPQRVDSSDPQPRLRGDALGGVQTDTSADPEQGSVGLHRIGAGLSGQLPMFWEVFAEPGAAGAYTLELERMGPRPSIVVGPTEGQGCVGDTPHLALAARAVDHGGTVELCPGTHEAYGGLLFARERARLVGEGSGEASVRSWAEAPVVRAGGLAHLEGVTLVPGAGDRANAVAVELSGNLAGEPLRLRDVRVLAAQQGAPQTLMRVVANVPDTDENAVEFEQIELVGPFEVGLDVQNAQGALLEQIEATGGATALRLRDVEGLEVQDVTILDVQRGIEGRDLIGARVERARVELSDDPDAERFGIRLAAARPDLLAPNAALVIRDVEVLGGLATDRGLWVRMQRAPTTALLERNRIDGAGRSQTGVLVSFSSGNEAAGEVVLQNNELLDHTSRAIAIDDVGRYDRVHIFNNTVRQHADLGTPVDLIWLDVIPSNPTGVVRLYNNLLTGFDSVDDRAVVFTRALSFEADYNLFSLVGALYVQNNQSLEPGLHDLPSTSGGIQPDPMFMGPQGGQVEAMSPAVDAGGSVWAPDEDIDGAARPAGAQIDIGAYER